MYERRFHLYKSNLYYLHCLCVHANSPLKQKKLWECHNILFLGHRGYDRTYAKIKSSFFWPNIKAGVRLMCMNSCNVNKLRLNRNVGLVRCNHLMFGIKTRNPYLWILSLSCLCVGGDNLLFLWFKIGLQKGIISFQRRRLIL